MNTLQCVCALTFFKLVVNVSVQGLLPSKHLSEKDKTAFIDFANNKHGGLRSDGIFEKFLKNMLDMLSTTFPKRKLDRYCRVLSRELDKMEYKHTKKLAKHFRHLSKMDREELQGEMRTYRGELDKKLPYRTEFLQGMNEVMTLRENLLFSDYRYDVRDYGNEDKLDIHEETRKVLNAIVAAVRTLSVRDQNRLEKKMRRALKEYDSEELDLQSILFSLKD